MSIGHTPRLFNLCQQLCCATVGIGVALGAGAAGAASYRVRPVHIPAGLTDAGFGGITQTGTIFGAGYDPQGNTQLFARNRAGALTLVDLGPKPLYSLAMNDAGEFAGTTNDGARALFTAVPGTIAYYPADAFHVLIDSKGDVAGTSYGAAFPSPTHGLIKRKAGDLDRFQAPGAGTTWINALNDGLVVSGYYEPPHPKNKGAPQIGFTYADHTLTPVVPPGRGQSDVLARNRSGAMVVAAFGDGQPGAFYLDVAGSFTQIAVPGATVTTVTGLNNDNEVYGLFATVSNVVQAFVEKAGVYTTITPPYGKSMFSLAGLDDRGTLVGRYWVDEEAGISRLFVAECKGPGC